MHMFPPQIPTLESECADGQQLQVDAKGANLSLSSLPTIVTTSDGYQHPAASACQWRAAAVEASPPDVLSPLYPYSPLSDASASASPVFPLTNETPTLALPIPNTCSWNPSLNELTFHSPSPIPIDHPFTLSYSPDFRDGGSAHLSPLLPDLKLPPSDDLLAGPETPPSPSPSPSLLFAGSQSFSFPAPHIGAGPGPSRSHHMTDGGTTGDLLAVPSRNALPLRRYSAPSAARPTLDAGLGFYSPDMDMGFGLAGSLSSPSTPTSPAATFVPHTVDPGTVSRQVATEANIRAAQIRRKSPARFQCHRCPQNFTAKHNLKLHLNSHEGRRPYPCLLPGCEFRASAAVTAKRHMKRCQFRQRD